MITVFADQYLYKLADYMPQQADLHFFDPAGGLPSDADTMDALLIRTVTPINEESLSRLPENLQFIATGSAGTDHVDTGLLAQKNIAFADAAGCNAQSVAEYVATALLIWAEEKKVNLSQKSVGIVGVGHVGSKVHRLLDKLHIKTVLYDPPREHREEDFTSASLSQVLEADILSFHLPLNTNGSWPTCHWFCESTIGSRSYDLTINTARGGIVDEQFLLDGWTAGRIGDYILDVWENEPQFSDESAQKAYLTTPHIAGYSVEAKRRASQMIAAALCDHFSLSHPALTKANPVNAPEISDSSLTDLLISLHPIKKYQSRLQKLVGLPDKTKEKAFNKLRSTFPLRREYASICLPSNISKRFPILSALFI